MVFYLYLHLYWIFDGVFAQIIAEPFVPKDWPGERSDLFTSRVTIDDVATTAAFLLKGPSVPGPMHPRDLGARGFGRLLVSACRTWTRHRTREQHLRRALIIEIAIGEAHARNRAAEAAVAGLVEIEARFKRNAFDRGAHRLAANL